MKKKTQLTIISVLLTYTCLVGCSHACTDRVVNLSLQNLSTDTIYSCIDFGSGMGPTSPLHLTLLRTGGQLGGQIHQSDLEIEKGYNIRGYVVRKSVADILSLDSVVSKMLYDTIYSYTQPEMEVLDYTIKVWTEDLYRHEKKE